ncbi:MAG: DUF1080 domain-containing protein [Pirellulales bacterium]|nr:DUF1080 domain-containing protein [Pirellulales bacterium]
MDKTPATFVTSNLPTLRQSSSRASCCLDKTSDLCRQKSICRQNDRFPYVGEFLRNSPPVSEKLAYGVTLIVFLLSAPTLHAAQPNQLTPEQIADGWISLFDGESLFGWQPTSDANWKVEDGAITVSEGEQGFLATSAEFADYELHVEFKAPPTTNSGIFLRTPLKPSDPAKDCYELNIAPADNPFPTGSLVGRINALDGLKSASTESNIGKVMLKVWDNQWHTFDVVTNGERVSIAIDGAAYEYLDPTGLTRGHISLQFREGPVAFRNIRLKPLGLKPMLNGKDLAGWNTDNAEASKFEITPEGELQVTNGRGILETDASYGDFAMQLDAYVDGDGLNSGVFFRSIPREYANGYESQIHNGYKDNDPTKPTDFGTGAIYRRVPARKVVSKDHDWFTMTLVPTGPHVSVWVNGYQTTDWTDTRPEHDNPRNGLRLKPGTIAIQGHDPTTNLRFRNLKIAELPEKTNHEGTKDTKEEER